MRFTTLDDSTPSVMSAQNWAWAFGLFIVSGFFAIGLLVVAGKHLRAVELSTVSYWETVVALLFGFLVFSEDMTFTAALGGVLIIIGGMGPILFELVLRKGEDPLAEGPGAIASTGGGVSASEGAAVSDTETDSDPVDAAEGRHR